MAVDTSKAVGWLAIVVSAIWIAVCCIFEWWSEIGLPVIFLILGVLAAFFGDKFR